MRFLLFLLLVNLSAPTLAVECKVRSGATIAPLVELYTSEGCDSCPPADRWLTSLAANPSVVPIGYHVDYWDYLGWKDRFGDARFSERQRQMARVAGTRAVYTPQVMIAGRDFTAWRNARSVEAALARAMDLPARASIEIERKGPVARVSAEAREGERTQDLVLHVALVESHLETQVRAGENRGATLRHDFVAREFHASNRWNDRHALIEVQLGRFPSASIAAFVQNRTTGEVLQALRGC